MTSQQRGTKIMTIATASENIKKQRQSKLEQQQATVAIRKSNSKNNIVTIIV